MNRCASDKIKRLRLLLMLSLAIGFFLIPEASVQAAKIPTVVLTKITASGGKVTLKWKKVKGVTGYRIYRKEGKGSYKKVKDILNASTTKYKDKNVEMGHSYTYTVRALVKSKGDLKKGSYDKKGLTVTMPVSKTSLTGVESASGRIQLRWKGVAGSDGYIISRREGTGGKYKKLTTICDPARTYYWDTTAKPGKSYFYSICTFVKVNGKTVKSDPHAPSSSVTCCPGTPIITSLVTGSKKDALTWTSVKGAEGYVVYKKNDATNQKWEAVKSVSKSTTTLQVKRDAGTTAYTVRAWVTSGKKKIYSQYRDSLTNAKREYLSSRILYDGDSITRGLTWSSRVAAVSYPERIYQWTGAPYDNISITGSTLARRSKSDTKSMVVRVEEGETDYTGYSVICLAAGTNDYNYGIELGNPESTSDKTFYGALHIVFEQIKEQNPEAKVVVITPTYRGRLKEDYSKKGMKVPNKSGYTLSDYCDALKNVAETYGAYVYDSQAAGIISEENYTTATCDALHPAEETYCQIGKSIAAFLIKKVLVKDEV